jgi:hypothetical protein
LRERAGRLERNPAIAPRDVREETLQRIWSFSGFIEVAQRFGRIIVANPSTPHLLHTVSPGLGGDSHVALSPDQRWVAEAPLSGSPRLWRLPEMVSRTAPERVRRILGSPESQRITPAQKALWEAESQRWTYARAAREISRCLTSRERTTLQLGPDPPCWCATKTFPSRAQWLADLGRDPFAGPRADGRRCSPQETAPWKVFDDRP